MSPARTIFFFFLLAIPAGAQCTGVPSSQTQTNVSSAFAELAGVVVNQLTSSGKNWNSYQQVPTYSQATGQLLLNFQPSTNQITAAAENGGGSQVVSGSQQGVWVIVSQDGNWAAYQGQNTDGTTDLYAIHLSAGGVCAPANLTNLHLSFVSPAAALIYSTSQQNPGDGKQVFATSEGVTFRTVEQDGSNLTAVNFTAAEGDAYAANVFHRFRLNPACYGKVWYKRDAANPNPNGTATPPIYVADWTNPAGGIFNAAIVGGAAVPADHNVWTLDGLSIAFDYNGKWYVNQVLNPNCTWVNGGSFGNATLVGPAGGDSIDYCSEAPDWSVWACTRATEAPPAFGGELFLMSWPGAVTGLALTQSSGSNDNSIPKPVWLDQETIGFTSDAASAGTPQFYAVTGFPQPSAAPAPPAGLSAMVN